MTPAENIDALIAGLTDWRGATLASLRKATLEADPDIIEEWKWMGSPVWSCDGNMVVGNAHKEKVKLTFSHGASLSDPDSLFNNGLGGKVWRAIDIFEGDTIDQRALKELIRSAVAYNQAKKKKKRGLKPPLYPVRLLTSPENDYLSRASSHFPSSSPSWRGSSDTTSVVSKDSFSPKTWAGWIPVTGTGMTEIWVSHNFPSDLPSGEKTILSAV